MWIKGFSDSEYINLSGVGSIYCVPVQEGDVDMFKVYADDELLRMFTRKEDLESFFTCLESNLVGLIK